MLMQNNDVVITMTAILSTLFAMLGGLIYIQTPVVAAAPAGLSGPGSAADKKKLSTQENYNHDDQKQDQQKEKKDKHEEENKRTRTRTTPSSSFYPDPEKEPSKYAYEMYQTCYSPIWIGIFAIIVIFRLYEKWTAWEYNLYLLLLALPCVLQPILFPSAFFHSPDAHRPLLERYSTKANVWLAIYSFIGNYWYTHYFYSVLKASYSMPSTRLNNVPIAMFFATMFYFSSYHVFSNTMLRKIKTTFEAGFKRRLLYISAVIVMSYFTAFMETLTISSFPYYSFEDRDMAYTIGSAFYGIYFLVSFPAFIELDNDIDVVLEEEEKEHDMIATSSTMVPSGKSGRRRKVVVTLWDTILQSCGYGMIILCLLDFTRLYLGIPLVVGGVHGA